MTQDVATRLREEAERIDGPRGRDAADALLARLGRYSHLPGVIKGLGRLDFPTALAEAALRVVRDGVRSLDPSRPFQTGQSLFELWAVISLAARADDSVLDDVERALSGDENIPPRIRELRRVTAQAHARAAAQSADQPVAASTPRSGAPEAPQAVGKVKAWLAAHSDPAPLAPHPGQKAAAKAAAVRALGLLGTDDAFEVLRAYATDDPSEPLLKELLAAWPRFERGRYAAAMFVPRRGHLDLGIVKDLDGIEAVPGLTSLRIVVDDKKDDQTDLSSLARCTGLESLKVQYNGPGMPTHLEWLRALPGLRSLDIGDVLRRVDLAPLAESHLERLTIWLDGQDPGVLLRIGGLRALTVLATCSAHSTATATSPHPDLTETVLTLVRRGVPVTVYDFDRPWAPEVLPAAESDGLQLAAGRGTTTIRPPVADGAAESGHAL